MLRGVGIATYNRDFNLEEVITSVLETVPKGTRVVVADDGSTDKTSEIVKGFPVIYVRGPNKGVAANKNRILFTLQDCQFIAILEDDLKCLEKNWFEIYEEVAKLTCNNHFCRVQDKVIPESHPSFTGYLKSKGYSPVYGSSPRGDVTFITKKVVDKVGGLNPLFRGAGYAHGEWSTRVYKAGLIAHPLRWIDIQEANIKFKQIGDTEGGRFAENQQKIKEQLAKNKRIFKQLSKKDYLYSTLDLG